VWLNGMPGTERPGSSAEVVTPRIETAGEPKLVPTPEPPEKAEVPVSRSAADPVKPTRRGAVQITGAGKPAEDARGREQDVVDARSNQPKVPDTANVSDFIAIPLGSGSVFRESGPIMRVEVSGAVLQSLGFPVPGDMYGRRVEAELLLGEGGLARAIRFVH
jgi:hypothetical protein